MHKYRKSVTKILVFFSLLVVGATQQSSVVWTKKNSGKSIFVAAHETHCHIYNNNNNNNNNKSAVSIIIIFIMDEQILHNWIAYMMIIQAIPIFFILLHIIPGKNFFYHHVRFSDTTRQLFLTILDILFRNNKYSTMTAPWGKTKPMDTSILSKLLGPVVPPKLSWFIMESPNLLWCILLCYHNYNNNHTPPVSSLTFNKGATTVAHYILLGMFFTHYLYRAIVYPYRLSHHTTDMPVGVVVIAFTFCTVNG